MNLWSQVIYEKTGLISIVLRPSSEKVVSKSSISGPSYTNTRNRREWEKTRIQHPYRKSLATKNELIHSFHFVPAMTNEPRMNEQFRLLTFFSDAQSHQPRIPTRFLCPQPDSFVLHPRPVLVIPPTLYPLISIEINPNSPWRNPSVYFVFKLGRNVKMLVGILWIWSLRFAAMSVNPQEYRKLTLPIRVSVEIERIHIFQTPCDPSRLSPMFFRGLDELCDCQQALLHDPLNVDPFCRMPG